MKNFDKALILSSLAFLLAAFGCSDSDGNATGIHALADGEELPACNADHSGELYLAHSGESFYCNGKGSWQELENSKGNAADSVREDSLVKRDTLVLFKKDTLVIFKKDTLVLRDTVFGANGESCSAETLENGSGYKILCGGDSVGVLLNGTKGDSGAPGANAENCTLSDEGNGTVSVICAADTVKLYKAVCGTEPYDPAKSFCSNDGSKNEIVALCNGAAYDLSREFCYDNGTTEAVVALCNGATYNLSREFCYDNGTTEVVIDRCNGSAYNLSTHFCKKGSPDVVTAKKFVTTEYLNQEFLANGGYGVLLDERDGQVYRTIQIGTQTWMAQNLNYAYNEGSAKSYCYDDNAENCEKYGRLYTWSAAMDSAAVFSEDGSGCGDLVNCTPADTVQGVCPKGWHLPSIAEFETLINAVGGAEIAVKKLKSTSGWLYSGNGTDDFGFSALPAGFRMGNGLFSGVGSSTRFLSATERSASEAYRIGLYDAVSFMATRTTHTPFVVSGTPVCKAQACLRQKR